MSEELSLILAFLFAVIYDLAYDRWGQHQRLTVLWVIFGVMATLFFAAMAQLPPRRYFIEWNGERIVLTNAQHAVLHVLKYFVATGIPMTVGAIRRWWTSLT